MSPSGVYVAAAAAAAAAGLQVTDLQATGACRKGKRRTASAQSPQLRGEQAAAGKARATASSAPGGGQQAAGGGRRGARWRSPGRRCCRCRCSMGSCRCRCLPLPLPLRPRPAGRAVVEMCRACCLRPLPAACAECRAQPPPLPPHLGPATGCSAPGCEPRTLAAGPVQVPGYPPAPGRRSGLAGTQEPPPGSLCLPASPRRRCESAAPWPREGSGAEGGQQLERTQLR